MRFWLGGFTADRGGSAAGIGVLLAGEPDDASAGGALAFEADAAPAPSPSWLAAHPTLDVVYAALEGIGKVAAFVRTGESTLDRLGSAIEAGESVCHVAVAPDGSSLIASCYGDGRVVRMTLDADGFPSAPLVGAAAADPYAEPDLGSAPPAQRASRAHAAAFLPDGRIATTDLGFDLVRIWRVAPAAPGTAGGLRLDHEVVLPKGSGPRHVVLHPSGYLHVLTEYSCEVYTLGPNREGRWALVAGTVASPQALTTFDSGAEIARSRDGAYLYAGLRGSNTIATLRVRGDGSVVEPVAQVDAGVDWPRHHTVVRDTLLVAGQRGDEVCSLTLDLRTGVPGRVRYRASVPTPTCLLPVR